MATSAAFLGSAGDAGYGATAMVAGDAPSADTTMKDQNAKREAFEKKLWYWNLAMAIMHTVWAIACLGVGLGSNGTASKFRIQTVTSYTSWTGQRGPVAALQLRQAVPFVALTSGFAWMSAAAHCIVLLCFKHYTTDLRRGRNIFRWYEYSASSSLMIVLIAMLFGVYEVHILFAIGSINACMNLFGLAHEILNGEHVGTDKPVDWTFFVFGCFAGAVPWAVIFSFIAGANVSGNVPGFVWGILIAYLIMFNTFPINMVLQYAQIGSWFKDATYGFPKGGYYFGEFVYQTLSLVAKTLLLWLVVGGVNQPSTFTSNGN